MEQQDEPVTLSLAGIARLAGVGRAAVSNWRRRHNDFPDPVGGTDASPMFSLTDAESWLLRHGKIDESSSGWDRLWPRIEDLGDRDGMAHLLASAGERLAIPTMEPPREAPGPGVADRRLVDEVVRLALRQSPEEAFTVLLDRWHAVHVRQLTATPVNWRTRWWPWLPSCMKAARRCVGCWTLHVGWGRCWPRQVGGGQARYPRLCLQGSTATPLWLA